MVSIHGENAEQEDCQTNHRGR